MGQVLNQEMIENVIDSFVRNKISGDGIQASFGLHPEEQIDKQLQKIKKDGMKGGVAESSAYVKGRTTSLVFSDGSAEEELRKIIDATIKALEGIIKGITGAYIAIKENKEKYFESLIGKSLSEAFKKTEININNVFEEVKGKYLDPNNILSQSVKRGWATRL